MLKTWIGLLKSRFVKVGIGLLVSAISLYLALKDVNLVGVGRVLSRADLGLVILALISTIANNLFKTFRWKILLGGAGRHIPFFSVLLSHVVGQMLNTVYPARVGELSRIYVVGGMGPERAFVAGTIVLEKILDMLSYVLLILWMVLWIPLPGWLSQSSWGFAGITFMVVTVLLWAFLRRGQFMRLVERSLGRFPKKFQDFTFDQVQSGFSSLTVLENKRNLILMAFTTALIWVFSVTTNVFTLQALAIDLPVGGAIIILIILQAGISLPAAPGKFGVFEYASILALSIYGITQEELAFGFGLLLHAVVLTPVLISGIFFLWWLGFNGQSWKKIPQPLDPGNKAP